MPEWIEEALRLVRSAWVSRYKPVAKSRPPPRPVNPGRHSIHGHSKRKTVRHITTYYHCMYLN